MIKNKLNKLLKKNIFILDHDPMFSYAKLFEKKK